MTINVNGLRQTMTRKTVYREIQNSKIDICFVQESFITQDVANQFRRDWQGNFIFTPGTVHSLGNIIVLDTNFVYTDLEVVYTSERILCIFFIHDDEKYCCINVYYPNEVNSKCKLHIEISNLLKQYRIDNKYNIIIGGDFNCVLKANLDNICGRPHSNKEIGAFQNFVEENKLFDIWRMFNDDQKQFTWKQKNKPIMRRLDYILCNESFLEKIVSSTISNMPYSDHRAVIIDASYNINVRGSGFWKFNNALLKDKKYIDMINETIESMVLINVNASPHILWDYCKKVIKDKSKIYGQNIAKKRNKEKKTLEYSIQALSTQLGRKPLDTNLRDKLNALEFEYNLKCLNELKGAQIRSKIKWVEEGEQNTKFFLTLEKIRGHQKIMTSLNMNGVDITDQDEIMQEQVNFYSNLYSNHRRFVNMEYENFLVNVDIPKLSEEEREFCDKNIDIGEIGKALKQLKNDSSPGLDGLTAAWYKFFWPKIKNLVFKSIHNSIDQSEMSSSQKMGIIRLLYKGKGARSDLKNWRPIALTNVDYKIFTKTLANRLKVVIPHLVHEDQNGYISGRSTAIALRTLDDIIEFTNHNYMPGSMITLDYSKAFDTISKEFMMKALSNFGFGRKFIKFVSVINNKTKSCINYNGKISPSFPLERGIRQGCPFSPLIFILACETLSIKIRQCNKIKGIELPCEGGTRMVKFIQFADDSTLITQDEKSIHNAFQIIEKFSIFSGLQLNKNKTEAIWLGCWKFKKKQVENIKWCIYPNNQIKVLGLYLQNNKQIHEIAENWESRIVKCQNIIKLWANRNLTIMGRIVVAKTFLLSQFMYLMQATILSKDTLKQINSLLFKYIWSKREYDVNISDIKITEKVKRITMIQNYVDKGLNMIDIESMQDTICLSWVRKLQNNGNGSWRLIPLYYFSLLSPKLTFFKCNTSSKNIRGVDQYIPEVYKRMIHTWLKVSNTNTNHTIHNSSQVIWNNRQFVYRGNCLYSPRWIKHNITFLSDIMTEEGHISYNSVLRYIPDSAITKLEYNSVYNAIKKYMNQYISQKFDNQIYVFNENIDKITNKTIKTHLQKLKEETQQNKWQIFFPNAENNLIENMWTFIPNCTKEPTLIMLQWKILHMIFATNKYLKKVGIKPSDICTYCNHVDSIEHYFVECALISHIWNYVENDIYKKCAYTIKLTIENIILGYGEMEHMKIINYLIIIAKLAISKMRYYGNIDLIMAYENEKTLRKL